MKTLHVSVADKIATYQARDGDIVCGNSSYQIQFAFDSEWDAYTAKTAVFKWNFQYVEIPFTGDTCPVPIIKNATSFTVGVYAGDLCTTTEATIGAKRSVLCNMGEHADPPKDVYNQLIDMINSDMLMVSQEVVGDMETSLDSIIATQEELMIPNGDEVRY